LKGEKDNLTYKEDIKGRKKKKKLSFHKDAHTETNWRKMGG